MTKESKKSEFKYKSVKKVTGVPFLKIETHEPVFITFRSAITVGMMKKKTAQFALITDLQTGEDKKLLLGSVLARTLLENYADDSFVGKSFRIEKGEKVKGGENEYFEYDLEEIEV